MGFAELIAELGDSIVRYHTSDVLERFKTGITPFCFDKIEDYNYFISQLSDFFKYYENMIFENRIAQTNKTNSHKKALEIMRDLESKYPKQFDQLFLLHILFESDSPCIINASLKFLQGKKVYIERYTQDNYGYKYIEIAATDELDSVFLKKEPEQRGEYEIGLRKFTREEMDFLSSIRTISTIEYLSPADLVYCAKKPEYVDSLFFNMFNYLQFAKDKTSEETLNSLILLAYRNLQFVNISRLKTLLLYRAMQYNEVFTLDSQLEFQENIIKELLEKVKSTRSVNLRLGDFSINISNPEEFTFEPHYKRENVINEFLPIYGFTADSVLDKTTVDIKGGLEISTKEVVSRAEEFLKIRKIDRFLEQYKSGELTESSIDFRDPLSLSLLKDELKKQIKESNPELSEKELDDIYYVEAKELIRFMYDKSIMDIQLARRFDEIVTAQLICDGSFNIQDKDLLRVGFSKNAIIYISMNNPEKVISFINLGYLKKEDFLMSEYLSIDIIQILFNSSQITINDILELVSLKKIDIASLKQIDIQDKSMLKEQLDFSILAKLYIDIARKRNEYENENKSVIENAISEGVQEEDVIPSERELQLQEELQSLINQKNIFIFLFRTLQLKDKEKFDFFEDVYLEILEKSDDMYGEFLQITEDMYKDGILSMGQINELDPRLLIELIKSGTVRAEDIEEFKKNAVLEDEISEIRELCDTEEEGNREIEELRYLKLKKIVDEIIRDSSISNEEKLGIIYNIYTLDTLIEKQKRSEYESLIWDGQIDSTFDRLQDTYSAETRSKRPRKGTDLEKTATSKKSDNYLYPPYMIWKFMRLLDPDISIKVYKDGNVSFCSKKLNKAMIEKVWKGNGEKVEREYGVATISMDLDVFEDNISKIIEYRRAGYRINTLNAKSVLPVILAQGKTKRVGIIRHNKDLKHSGRKIWFESLLDNFGINIEDIRQGKDTRYAPEDSDKIEEVLKEARSSYERI